MSPAREPGALEEASPSMVDSRQPRKGDKPRAVVQCFEKSDEVIVPKKSAKTWVTPGEPMEERTEAKRKSAARNAPPAQDGKGALTYLQWIGSRAKNKAKEQFTNLLSHIKAPLLKEAYQRLKKHAASGVDGVSGKSTAFVLTSDCSTCSPEEAASQARSRTGTVLATQTPACD
jgi:hypothetical protein